jgi:hypothetical protein
MGQSQQQQLEDPTDTPPPQFFPNPQAMNSDQQQTTFPTSYQFTRPQAQIGQNDQILPSIPQARTFYGLEGNNSTPFYPPYT